MFYCWVQFHDLPPWLSEWRSGSNMLEKAKIPRVSLLSKKTFFIVGDFAKAYVQVSLSRPLLSLKIIMQNAAGIQLGRRFKLKKLRIFCYHCGFVGHSMGQCPAYQGAKPLSEGHEEAIALRLQSTHLYGLECVLIETNWKFVKAQQDLNMTLNPLLQFWLVLYAIFPSWLTSLLIHLLLSTMRLLTLSSKEVGMIS